MYENLKQTLSFYGIDCHKPYYISSGNTIYEFPENTFRMDFYTFCVCTKGKMTLDVDNNEYTFEENTFLISAPSTTVHFKSVSEDFKMKLLLFDKNFLLKNLSNPFIIEKMILFQNDMYSVINADAETARNLLNLLTYLEEKSKLNGKFTEEIIRTIIFNLLLELAEITHQKDTKPLDAKNLFSDVYLRFRELVAENILEHKSVQFYADKLNISNKYLIEIVKRSSEKTPHEIIDEILLKEAYVLLGDTELSISEIAFKLRFNSTSAFGRFFKKYASISPSEYRIKENLVH